MASTTLRSLLSALPTDPSWAPPETKDSTLGGIPYAPYSKGDKLGRMADWTAEGKDRERGGQRQQYGNRYRGKLEDVARLLLDVTLTHCRSTSIWCRTNQSFRFTGCRRRVDFLRCRQQPHSSSWKRIWWTWWFCSLPGPRRAWCCISWTWWTWYIPTCRWHSSRWTRRSTRVRQQTAGWTRRPRRTSFRLERLRQTTTQP